MNKIKLSVIVPSYNSRKTIQRCLRSLTHQTIRDEYEVIVVDTSNDGTADLIQEQFPNVGLFQFSERKFPGDARNFGISKAKGEIFAFTDADCEVDPNWVEAIIKAHEKPFPAIGGAIDNGNPESYAGWGYYFCEFSQWVPETREQQMIEIPTCCLSLKRWAFEKYGPFLEGTYCSDTVFHWKLGRDGYKPLYVPAIQVRHINVDQIYEFLKHQISHGKFFGEVRSVEQNFSPLRRVMYLVLSPLLPFLLFFRVGRRVARKRKYRKQFLLSLPLVFCGITAWSFGEFLGYRGGEESTSGPEGSRICNDEVI